MAGTTYLITGANKGIGRAMVQQLLQRANNTVVAGVRQPDDPTSASLCDLPVAENSRVVVLQLRNPADFEALPTRLGRNSITRIDTVVANAGNSSGLDKSLLQTDPEDVVGDCTINAAGPLRLFRATWPLLEASLKQASSLPAARFILVSSTMGSIGVQDTESMPVGTSYGMSKAAANWFAKKASIDFKAQGLVVGVLHPGWVQTSMGQALADALGMKEPPITADESARYCLGQIDDWTMDKTGKFLTYKGQELPW
ncbi:hypothetical protein SEUCBS139899_006034 [Sporothrix eucalyptigena]|uniref:Ketoreductase domain-containing protein n=1 Tax=Sporothrix eucalyptigena TaxID=1812306 RepID=A0ABP0CZU3_9PEZI